MVEGEGQRRRRREGRHDRRPELGLADRVVRRSGAHPRPLDASAEGLKAQPGSNRLGSTGRAFSRGEAA